jgi:hypothetical protein
MLFIDPDGNEVACATLCYPRPRSSGRSGSLGAEINKQIQLLPVS